MLQAVPLASSLFPGVTGGVHVVDPVAGVGDAEAVPAGAHAEAPPRTTTTSSRSTARLHHRRICSRTSSTLRGSATITPIGPLRSDIHHGPAGAVPTSEDQFFGVKMSSGTVATTVLPLIARSWPST